MMSPNRNQQGWVMISAIIMLFVMTLMALMAMRNSTTTNQIVANVQTRNVTATAAQSAIDMVINSRNFLDNPDAPIPVANRNCPGAPANQFCVDTNGDNTPDIEVTITQADTTNPLKVGCTSFRPIANGVLNLADATDKTCIVSQTNPMGIEVINPTDPSLCADSAWDIRADARDLITEARVVVHQGISVRVEADVESACE